MMRLPLDGLRARTTARTSALSLAALVVAAAPVEAAVCVFPDYEETCSGDDCELDFAEDNSDTSHIQSDVLLDERRARARANGGLANTNVAIAEIGVHFRPAVEMDAVLKVGGSYRGQLDGGIGQAFGNFRIGLVLRDLDEGEVMIDQELAAQEKNDGGPTLGVHGDVAGEISQHLLKDKNYALSLRLRVASRGQAIAHSNFSGDTGGVVFERFSIAGVSRAADADGDRLPDLWESEGIRDCDGQMVLNLPAMGADPNRQDLFVEIDWIEGSAPSKQTIAAVKSAFLEAPADAGGSNNAAEPGIVLHVDTGALYDPARRESPTAPPFSCGDNKDNDDGDGADADDPDCQIGDNLGGGEAIPFAEIPNFDIQKPVVPTVPGTAGDGDGDGRPDLLQLKEKFFDPRRRFAFRYGIFTEATDREFVPGLGQPGTTTVSSCDDGFDNDGDGKADRDDKDDCFDEGGQARGTNFVIVSDSPVTLMHEIGHTLGLAHGGPSFFTEQEPPQFDINCKPNYVSIMNYSLSGGGTAGIRQLAQDVDGDGRNDTGQDLDGDGVSDGRIIDYSPPRFVVLEDGEKRFKRSIIDALPTLDESCLNRTTALDPSDPQNHTAYTNDLGVDVEWPVSVPIDWKGSDPTPDDPFDEHCFPANVNLYSDRCKTDPAQFAQPPGQVLGGANDWRNIVFNPRVRDRDDTDKEDIIEPTLAEMEAAAQKRDRADLTVIQSIAPDPAVAGQPLTITLTIENLGPNHVSAARVVDLIDSDIEVVALDSDCVEDPENTVTCHHGDFSPGDQRSFEIEGRLRTDLECDGRQFVEMHNSPAVENVHGLDPQSGNDGARHQFRVLCVRYEAPAKMVCGEQPDRQRLGLLAGRYGTTVNIHNPNDEQVSFFAKFAVATTAHGRDTASRTLPVGVLELGYDESLAIDCDRLRKETFEGELPGDLVDGYLVVQSPRKLDVDSVYTTAGLETVAELGLGSVDVERVPVRDRAELKRPLPDLNVQLTCDMEAPGGGGSPGFVDVTIANQGEGDADPFSLRLQFEGAVVFLQRPLLELGQQTSVSVAIPESCGPDCAVTAVADAGGVVDELKEHNNLAQRTCTVGQG